MSQARMPEKFRWTIAILAVASLVIGVVGGDASPAAAVPPTTITLATDRTEIGVGQSAVLTATSDYAATSALPTRIVNQTTGVTVKTCTSGTTCTSSQSFSSGGPYTYVATVNGLTSGSVSVARTAWTVSLTSNITTFALGQTVSLVATANQSVVGSAFRLYIFDTTTGERMSSWNGGATVTRSSTGAGFFASGGPHTYVAVVAASTSTYQYYSQITDVQATSGPVTLTRQPWTVALSGSTSTYQGATTLTLTADANQDVGYTSGGYRIHIFDWTTGNRLTSCLAGTQCGKNLGISTTSPGHVYVAIVGSGGYPVSVADIPDVQATSNGYSASTGNGATLAHEVTGGGNLSEKYCQSCHGDPVNTATGEFYLPATDIGIPGAGPSLAVARTYSSALAATNGPFGYGWSGGFSARLGVLVAGDSYDPRPRQVQITQENGATVVFSEGQDTLYTAPPRVMATLTRDTATGQWTYTRQSRDVLLFDSAGRLTAFKDLHGSTVSVGYDGSNQVTSLSASGGRTLTLTWASGRVTQVADSAGRTVSYAYTGGNLTAVTAVDGAVTGYGYDSAHYLTTLTKPGSAVTANVYDSSHRVTSQTDPLGRVMAFAYTSTTTTVTYPGGAKTAETYSGGRIVSKTLGATTALAATTSYVYDEASNLLTITNPLGQATTMTYDSAGNLLTRTDPLGRTTTWTYNALRKPLTSTDPLGRTTTFTYNSAGDLLTTTSPAGRLTTLTYNPDGSVASTVNAAAKVTTFAYDSAGRLTSTTDPDGLESTAGYNAAGNLVSATTPDGETTSTTVDAFGRPLTVTDPNGHVSSFMYDVRGNATSATDANGNLGSKTYDLADRVTSTTDAAGKVTSLTYTTAGLLATVTDANGHATTNAYNTLGQLTSATDANSRVTGYTYDAAGRSLSTTLPSGAVSSVVYDAAGQVTSSTNPNSEVTQFTYNLAGQLSSTTDPLARVTSFSYTNDGQQSVTTLPDSTTRTSTYTVAGQLATFSNADGKVTTYNYTDGGRPLGKVEPGGLETTTDYDAGGRVDTMTLPDGSTKTYSYDDAGQVIGVHYSATGSTDTTYAYDDGGRISSMADATGTSSFTYDSTSRMLSETDGDGSVISYDYDFVGQLTSITYPGSRTATYAYDAAGQMVSVTDWASNTTTFDWTANGQLESQVTPNGVTQSNSYDLTGRTTEISTSTSGGSIASFEYDYDAAGQIVADTSTNGGVTTAHDYGYDLLNQLGSVDTTPAGGPTVSGAFDATSAGQLVATAGGAALTYDATQQLTDLVPASGPSVAFEYDGNGSRTSSAVAAVSPDPALTTEYAYTPTGALASVTTPAVTVGYTVDGRGLRQSRTIGSATDDFTWSTAGALPLLLEDGDRAYLYGPSLAPIAQVDGTGGIEYLHGDLLGSVRAITDDTGAVAGRSTFDAFGVRTAHTGTADSAFGFTGNWTDPDTGLVHLRARDYDPATGQFFSVDPAVDATRQPYAYTGNNPLLLTDPSGLCPLTDGTNVPDCTAEALGAWTWLASGTPSDVLDFLEPAANSLAGLADGATGGLTEQGRIANGSDCQIEKDGWYWTEFGLGTVASLITGGAVVKALSKILRAGDLLSSFSRVNSAIGNTVHGNSASSSATAYVYRLMSETGEYLKTGISQNPGARYTLGFMADKGMDILTSGVRSEMLALERFIVQRDPGPLNLEKWAGAILDDLPW